MVLTAAPPPPRERAQCRTQARKDQKMACRGVSPHPLPHPPGSRARAAGKEAGEQACPDLTGSAPPPQKARLQLGCSEGLRGQLW